jgi:hypothetical protein
MYKCLVGEHGCNHVWGSKDRLINFYRKMFLHLVNGKDRFIQDFSKQWPLKAPSNYCPTFTHSYTHLQTDGAVPHARRQPALRE